MYEVEARVQKGKEAQLVFTQAKIEDALELEGENLVICEHTREEKEQ